MLSQVAYDKNWYWPASRLFRLDSSHAELMRSDILSKLKFMQVSLEGEEEQQVKRLIQQISGWKLADRIFTELDYDKAQLLASHNQRFEHGDYFIQLFERRNTINLFGLVEQSTDKMENSQCGHEVIHQLVPTPINKDFAYIIQPDGVIKKIGIAYWNATCVDIMPESDIFMPFTESQFSTENSALNKQIIDLAKNRIMQ